MLERVGEYIWEVPRKGNMNVPVRVYASENMISQDNSIKQAVNSAALPTLQKSIFVMPDIHEGYGVPIGCVLGSRIKEGGIISPGAIGFDINCGVRVLKSDLAASSVDISRLARDMQKKVPSGLGKGFKNKISSGDLEGIMSKGSSFLLENGIGEEDDAVLCEEEGCMEGDVRSVSDSAKKRGLDQVGTLGSGNHFLELQVVKEVVDESVARVFGIHEGQLLLMIHCGSRGLGHQVASEYMKEALKWSGTDLPDKELAYMPFNSSGGARYWGAMSCAANFAFANRHAIANNIRKVFPGKLSMLYDVAHNIAKREVHEEDDLLVHRKGATRSFWKGHKEVSYKYREVGQPVLVPGSMGTASWIMVGKESSESMSFGSTCHGAGRVMSRGEAKRNIKGEEIRSQLSKRGVAVLSGSFSGIAEEAPEAYKDVESVVDIVSKNGLSGKVARLLPLAAIKG